MKAEKLRIVLERLCIDRVLVQKGWEELHQLEAKAQELDRRENGTIVHSRYFVYGGVEYGKCKRCNEESIRRNNYCRNCGTKLIWESEA